MAIPESGGRENLKLINLAFEILMRSMSLTDCSDDVRTKARSPLQIFVDIAQVDFRSGFDHDLKDVGFIITSCPTMLRIKIDRDMDF